MPVETEEAQSQSELSILESCLECSDRWNLSVFAVHGDEPDHVRIFFLQPFN